MPLRLAVVIEEIGEVFEGLFEHFHARQVHDAEVIGLGPVKAAAARDQNLLLVQQVEGKLLVIGDVELLNAARGLTTEMPSILLSASYTKLRCS